MVAKTERPQRNDVVIAIRAMHFAPGLSNVDQKVGALILKHYNRTTGQCDPGNARLATMLGIDERTVRRATAELCGPGRERSLPLHPSPPHSQVFCRRARFLTGSWRHPADRHQQNQHVTGSRGQKMANNSRFRADKFPLDLFGEPLDDRPKKQPVPKASCARCGKKFPAPKRSGRPARYCGEACRKATKLEMTSRFAREDEGQNLTPGDCRECGKPIVIGRRRGRFPYWCSPACKRLAMHPTLPRRGGDIFDLLNPERTIQ
jgi:hypothetical protein